MIGNVESLGVNVLFESGKPANVRSAVLLLLVPAPGGECVTDIFVAEDFSGDSISVLLLPAAEAECRRIGRDLVSNPLFPTLCARRFVRRLCLARCC